MKFTIYLLVFGIILLTPGPILSQHPVLTELYQFTGWKNGTFLGNELLNPGDLNGDGFDEYISWGPNNDRAIFFWGAFPVDTIPDLTIKEDGNDGFIKSVGEMTLGDIDGDSLPELIAAYIGHLDHETFIYKLGPGADTLADFILPHGGSQVCTGDLNGDGFEDIILADSDSALYKGRIRIFLGGDPFDSNLDYGIIGDTFLVRLGMNVATGDLNGDGYDDLIAWGNNLNISPSYDYLRVYLGSQNFDTVYDFQLNDPSTNPSILGFADLSLLSFDYNNDSYDDLFVGGIFIYNGSASFDTIPEQHLVWPSQTFNAYIQGGGIENLFSAGDINNDGYEDLAIGMDGMFGGKGLVHVKLAGAQGISDEYIILEPSFGASFGNGIIHLNDVDGNGVSDILIGHPGWPWTAKGTLHFYSGDSTIFYEPPAVGIESTTQVLVRRFQLFQNYPNPFNNTTAIPYRLSQAGYASLRIYDIQGRLVRTLQEGQLSPGNHTAYWDGSNRLGKGAASGIYLYRLTMKGGKTNYVQQQTHKMLYLK